MAYEGFEKYDVLQIKRGAGNGVCVGEWLDYSTLRTESEAREALRYCNGTHREVKKGDEFRIVGFDERRAWLVKVEPSNVKG
jgi:hypothetical protein